MGHSITTKCPWPRWEATSKYTRKLTNAALGHSTQSMGGTWPRPPSTTAHTNVTSKTRGATASVIQSNFNTRTSPSPPCHTTTNSCEHWRTATTRYGGCPTTNHRKNTVTSSTSWQPPHRQHPSRTRPLLPHQVLRPRHPMATRHHFRGCQTRTVKQHDASHGP